MDLGRSRNESSVCSDNLLPMKVTDAEASKGASRVLSTPRLAQSQIYDTSIIE